MLHMLSVMGNDTLSMVGGDLSSILSSSHIEGGQLMSEGKGGSNISGLPGSDGTFGSNGGSNSNGGLMHQVGVDGVDPLASLLDEERVRMELKLKTQAVMEKRRLLNEQAMEEDNRVMMSEEDARTRAVETFLRRLAAEKLRAERRRREREEAARVKREDALRNLEDGLRKMKINRALDRRAKTHGTNCINMPS